MTLYCMCLLRDTPIPGKNLNEMALGWSRRALHLFRQTGNDWGTEMSFRQLEHRFDALGGATHIGRQRWRSIGSWVRAMVGEYAEQIKSEESHGRWVGQLHSRRLKLAESIRDNNAIVEELAWQAFDGHWRVGPDTASRRAKLIAACEHLMSGLVQKVVYDGRVRIESAKLDDVFRHNRALLARCRAEGQKLTLAEAVSLAVRE